MLTDKQARQKITDSIWSVKNVQFMPGHDAQAMSCSLYRDGKRVATVFDDSWGGDYQYTWLKEDYFKELNEFGKSMLVESKFTKKGLTYNADIVVETLAIEYELIKKYKKLCKRHTVVRLKSQPDHITTFISNHAHTSAPQEEATSDA